jgi:hypothetical protein
MYLALHVFKRPCPATSVMQFADQWRNNDRKLGDHSYLSWNSEQPSGATTTGRSARGEGA